MERGWSSHAASDRSAFAARTSRMNPGKPYHPEHGAETGRVRAVLLLLIVAQRSGFRADDDVGITQRVAKPLPKRQRPLRQRRVNGGSNTFGKHVRVVGGGECAPGCPPVRGPRSGCPP
jgi:hypothetical protein